MLPPRPVAHSRSPERQIDVRQIAHDGGWVAARVGRRVAGANIQLETVPVDAQHLRCRAPLPRTAPRSRVDHQAIPACSRVVEVECGVIEREEARLEERVDGLEDEKPHCYVCRVAQPADHHLPFRFMPFAFVLDVPSEDLSGAKACTARPSVQSAAAKAVDGHRGCEVRGRGYTRICSHGRSRSAKYTTSSNTGGQHVANGR